MTLRTKLHIPRRALPGILALATALVMTLVLMLSLSINRPMPEAPETTAPPTVPPSPFLPSDFTYNEDGYLTCSTGTAVLGIDVSEHQNDIDWDLVKAAGVEFVMIRVGWRGQTEGKLTEDTMAQINYAGARAAGLKVGAYFFSQAITEQEAVAEAEFAMDRIRGWELDMPLVFDWEYVGDHARTADMDPGLLTDISVAFCETVALAGYEPMIYFNVFQSEYLLHLEELTQYPFWLAMYSDRMDYPYAVDMWQYSCTGQVAGIETDVDLNLWFPDSQN